jgi:phospholipid/cholesterol/gamma-HCH transport system substrate-binding protein
VSGVGRVAALGAVIAAVALVAIVLFGGGSGGYEVTAKFINAGQIVKGNPVQTGGTAIGSVKDIQITDDGQAEIKFEVEEKYTPLRRGTRAAIKQFSQSGIANRYIDLTFPSGANPEIDDGGRIETDNTRTAVDLDQLFNTIDPETGKALQDFFKGQERQFRGAGAKANDAFKYLNPAFATSSRLFSEVTRDQPTLERFLVDSSQLVTALAERRDDLSGLIGNLNETTRALGNQKGALAESIELLPPFMRRANTTFVNLRAALDDVDPLVDASKPTVAALGPFLTQARGFARDAKPTVRDLRLAIRRPGRDNDLIEFIRSVPPLADIAVETKQRNGEARRGAFPESVQAFRDAAPIIASGRPYTQDLIGWFDDFSTTGGGFDALGAYARGQITFQEFTGQAQPVLSQGAEPAGELGPVRQNQFKRCPGAAEEPTSDGSNVFSEAEQRELQCDEGARATGNAR